MRGNSRIIALSLVAIVLGAGYLMRVIPPIAEIDIADSDAVTIDGKVVTNPLDLEEFVPMSASQNPGAPFANNSPSGTQTNPSPTDAAGASLPGDPLTDVFLLASPAGSTFEGSFEDATSDAIEPKTDSSLTPPPLFENNPLSPPLANPTRSTGPGSSNPDSPGSEGNTPPQIDTPDDDQAPPDITLPTDPRDPAPNLPELDDDNTPGPPWNITDPIKPPTDRDDPPTHRVPDSGSTLALAALSLAALAALRRKQR